MTLSPGEGAFIDNDVGNGGPINVTLVGQVRLNSDIAFVAGLGIASSVIPQAGLVTDLGLVVPAGQQFSLSRYNRNTSAFDTFVYDEDSGIPGGWNPNVPSVNIGEAWFWDSPPGSATFHWIRNFPVGP
jgi:hypothetical protein